MLRECCKLQVLCENCACGSTAVPGPWLLEEKWEGDKGPLVPAQAEEKEAVVEKTGASGPPAQAEEKEAAAVAGWVLAVGCRSWGEGLGRGASNTRGLWVGPGPFSAWAPCCSSAASNSCELVGVR